MSQLSHHHDKWSEHTVKEIEEEIAEKGLNSIVEEICGRERYRVKIVNKCKRYFKFCDNEEDEMVKKIRLLGKMKLQHDMDISKLFKKIRNFEVWNSLLLNERQKYLL